MDDKINQNGKSKNVMMCEGNPSGVFCSHTKTNLQKERKLKRKLNQRISKTQKSTI